MPFLEFKHSHIMSSQAVAGPSGLRGRKDPVRPADIEQGRILWLPPTVRLVKAIIEGNGRPRFPQVIKSNPEALPSDNHYDHPIVVLSRPADDPETMHFAVVRHAMDKKFRSQGS